MRILLKTYKVKEVNINRIKFLHRRINFLVKFKLYKIIRKHSIFLKTASLHEMEILFLLLDKLFSLYHD